MLQDRTHKLVVGTWLLMALVLSAGLVQADAVSGDLNESKEAADNVSIENNATIDMAVDMAVVVETIDSENSTDSVAETENDTSPTEMEMVEEFATEPAVETVEIANETGYVSNESIEEAVPEEIEETEEAVPEEIGETGEAVPEEIEETEEAVPEEIEETEEAVPEEIEETGEAVVEMIRTVCLNGCNYTTIGAAIEAAEDGDVVEVGSGTYNENVVVDKSITLRGVNTGEGVPVVNALGNGSTVILKADGIVLEGFYITNAGPYPSAGIEVTSNDNLISRNGVWNSDWVGIYLKGCTNTTIFECITSNNGNDGILIFRAPGNFVGDNVVSNNGDDGIAILQSDGNRVEGNVVGNNTDVGIFLDTSSNAIVVGNTLSYNVKGIGLLKSGIDRVGPNRFVDNAKDLEVA
ncbi:MAG: Cell surface protein [Methanothrix harundinacea]|uniref:Cell surface protein n=1 Tax=Methanothrix harundinacea TaxID=301375 RepID=A0A101FTN8_9EURY|nr:MAG: Cell surface protein [Methanothrix harundinacea]